MDYFPLFARIDNRRCLVVGGGKVAHRKVRQLRAAGARVSVNAPALCEALAALQRHGQIDWLAGRFVVANLDRHLLVIAATDDEATNDAVSRAANEQGRLVNVVDDLTRSSYITPAVVDRSPVVIAVSSGGAAPVLARQLRARIEALLPVRLGDLATLAAAMRARVRAAIDTLAGRRRFWERLFDGPVADHVYAGRSDLAHQVAEQALGSATNRAEPDGQVSLVGAGPGDPGLLTLRAVQVMQSADVVLHDRLVAAPVLALARRDADLIEVGKAPGGCGFTQARINALMLRLAGEGKRVCRLKGGDPFIFGRGGEELEALSAAGIAFEVVPGITAAAACAAYAGIPLTHRGLSQSVRFVTAHCERSVDCLDWQALAAERQTLAFYMGVRHAGKLSAGLIAHGRAARTPVAVIERGTRPDQRVLTGTLGGLAGLVNQQRVRSPSIIIVGEVASLATRLGWFAPSSAMPEATDREAVPDRVFA